MPYKHQTASYRTRRGQRFVCDGDVPERYEALARVAELRDEGFKAFFETHDGYARVFVEQAKYPAAQH